MHALAAGGPLRQDIDKAIKLTLTTAGQGTCSISVRRGKHRNFSVAVDGDPLGERLQNLESPFSVFVAGLTFELSALTDLLRKSKRSKRPVRTKYAA